MIDNLISVIIPVYKVEKYLDRCVNSVINQIYRNLEIILVDDGSPDNCPVMCDEYAKKDSRIKVIHQKNGGLSAARNAGIEAATGAYIGFVDSDDYIAFDMYEKLLQALVDSKADLAICNHEFVDQHGNSITELNAYSPLVNGIFSNHQMFEKLSEDGWWYYIAAWNKLYKRQLFERVRYPIGKIHEDTFVIHDIFYACNRIVTLENTLYYYVQREGSIINSKISIRNLDEVEGFCKRIDFYMNRGMDCYAKGTLCICEKKFLNFRARLNATNKLENMRIAEIDSLFKKTYFRVTKSINLKYFCLPIYVGYIKVKAKLRIRSRIKNEKTLAKYRIGLLGKNCVLLDTPMHENLGDHAIVMAEQQFLDRYRSENKYLELTAAEINHHERRYARLTPRNRIIVVHGGGFLGALWPDEEYRFRRILKAFSKHRVIVFPQTVTFDMETEEGRAFFEESKRVYESHPNLTVFVREKKSEEFMRTYLPRIPCVLVPDIVTIMEADIPKHGRNGILFCMRRDVEKNISQDELNMLIGTVKRHYLDEKIDFTDTVVDYMIQPKDREREVLSKLEQFSKAKLVITDRLHGMIFAALTNTPCIALSNSNGKVGAVYKWIKCNEYIIYLDTIDAVEDALNSLDLNRTYSYRRDVVLRAFEPLIQLLEVKK